jgi:hypothetical protein
MPSPIGGLTVRNLIYFTYSYFRSVIDNADRDFIQLIQIKEVTVYDGKAPGKARTKFIIQSRSTPQYYPYYRPKDSRGRAHATQRTIRHNYDVTISMDKLTVDSPIKFRTGADCAMLFGKGVRAQFDKKGKMLRDDLNILRGRMPDFFFRFEYVLWKTGNLYGRNWTNGPPSQVNPRHIPAFDKHAMRIIKILIQRGILKA